MSEQELEQAEVTPEEGRVNTGSEVPPADSGQGQDNFDKAEYTRKTQMLAELSNKASEYGFDNPREFMEYLEKKAVENAFVDTPGDDDDEQIEDVTPEPHKQDQPKDQTGNTEIEQLKREIDAIKQASLADRKERAKAELNTMFTDFKVSQSQLPEDERYDISRSDIDTFLNNRRNFIAVMDMANEEKRTGGSGNIYQISAEVLALKKLRGEIVKKGDESKKALSSAEKNAQVLTSNAPPAGEKKKENTFVDTIAPDMRQKF